MDVSLGGATYILMRQKSYTILPKTTVTIAVYEEQEWKGRVGNLRSRGQSKRRNPESLRGEPELLGDNSPTVSGTLGQSGGLKRTFGPTALEDFDVATRRDSALVRRQLTQRVLSRHDTNM